MQNLNKRRILAAFAFGTALILLSLTLRSEPQAVTGTPVDQAPVITIADRSPITINDSNQDGVPDWQESFSDDVSPTILPDGTNGTYEPDGTLTEQFAREFFEQLVSSDMAGGFGESPDELVNRASEVLVGVGEDTLYTPADLTISSINTTAALATYGETVARMIIDIGCAPEKADADVLSEAVRNNDPAALAPLACRTETYADYETTLLAMPVPSLVVSEHLDLVNVMQAMHHNLSAFEGVFTDPLQALVRVKRYDDDLDVTKPVLHGLYQALLDKGVQWPDSSPVFAIIAIE